MNTLLEKISTINDMILQGQALEAFDKIDDNTGIHDDDGGHIVDYNDMDDLSIIEAFEHYFANPIFQIPTLP